MVGPANTQQLLHRLGSGVVPLSSQAIAPRDRRSRATFAELLEKVRASGGGDLELWFHDRVRVEIDDEERASLTLAAGAAEQTGAQILLAIVGERGFRVELPERTVSHGWSSVFGQQFMRSQIEGASVVAIPEGGGEVTPVELREPWKRGPRVAISGVSRAAIEATRRKVSVEESEGRAA